MQDQIKAFEDADNTWQSELESAFGKDAGLARYEARGRGQPGTALQDAYLAREAAHNAWIAASNCGRSKTAGS